MDDKTLAALRAAVAAAPENAELRLVLVGAHLERDEGAEAAEALGELQPGDVADAESRLVAARACLAADQAEAALAWAADDTPNAGLLRARALLALGRQADGLTEYRAAVAKNPALEDVGLRDRLAVNVRAFKAADDKGERPLLRVVSNDDTDRSELDRLLMPEEEKVTFADVGGLADVKRQIHKRIILPFQKPSLFRRFKKRIGGGILLYGPPGCGKTLLARATAGECAATFLNVVISDVLDMYIGEGEKKLHALFEKARESAPTVLFFDEVEALGGKRQFTRDSSSSKLVSQFLSELDGFAQNNSGVLILGATNVPWAVDSAFRRPGRFDRLMFVPPPDRDARRVILELLVADRPHAEPIDFAYLVKHTSGFSGADLLHLVETAADEAIEASIENEEEIPVHDDHLRRALKEVRPTTLEWLTTARNYARYSNESGQYDDVIAFLRRHGKG